MRMYPWVCSNSVQSRFTSAILPDALAAEGTPSRSANLDAVTDRHLWLSTAGVVLALLVANGCSDDKPNATGLLQSLDAAVVDLSVNRLEGGGATAQEAGCMTDALLSAPIEQRP